MPPQSKSTQDNEPVFFWRPHEDYGYFGQWYTSPFTTPAPHDPDQTVLFQNAETYMMYHKALLFNDVDIAEDILASADDPKAVKALGRKVKGFDGEVWDKNKFNIVVNGNREKFRQNAELRQFLLSTGDREIIEASPMDKIWGIGFGKVNAPKNKSRWGQNLLGKAIMQVRAEIQSKTDVDSIAFIDR
jgi:ribA/ribD-fused uncharacterized protein